MILEQLPRDQRDRREIQIPFLLGARFREMRTTCTRLWLGRPGAQRRLTAEMTRALPFTAASLARAIKGVELAGRFVVGVKADGTVIVGDKPVDTTSLVPADAQSSPPPVRRFGDALNGGQSAA